MRLSVKPSRYHRGQDPSRSWISSSLHPFAPRTPESLSEFLRCHHLGRRSHVLPFSPRVTPFLSQHSLRQSVLTVIFLVYCVTGAHHAPPQEKRSHEVRHFCLLHKHLNPVPCTPWAAFKQVLADCLQHMPQIEGRGERIQFSRDENCVKQQDLPSSTLDSYWWGRQVC